MKQKPLVSILLPVGKDKRFLDEAIESIKQQTYKNFELLVEEDKGEGITKTLIKLIKKAKGEFLARMDADDISEPDRLEKQVNYLNSHPDVMLVGSWTTLIDESGKKIGVQKMPVGWEEIKKTVFYQNPLIHPSWMMRKKWFERVGRYNPDFKFSQDWELLLRRVWKDKIENIPEPLIKLRIHKESSSFTHNKKQAWCGIKARFETIQRGDIPFWKVIFLLPNIVSLIIPTKLKYLYRSTRLSRPEAVFRQSRTGAMTSKKGQSSEDSPHEDCLHGRGKVLGIVLPMGQNERLLIKSGQWSLWESEIEFYKKEFAEVIIFEYRYSDWRRFLEALFLPIIKRKHFASCNILKAVHLTGAIPCLIAKWFYNIPYILSYGYRYDQFAKLENKWLQWLLVKLLTSIAIRSAGVVMIPTEELEEFIKIYGARRTAIIPNGVDLQAFKGLRISTINYQPLTILFVGRLEKQKNLKTLIRAIQKLQQILKGQSSAYGGLSLKVRLIFLGNGSLKEKLIKSAKEFDVSLEIIDSIPNDQLPAIYNQADIFILPSLIEGHPKVLLEAMACGLPCIASDIPGCREIIVSGKNGLLAEPTILALADCLNRLIKDSRLREKLGKEARKTIEEKFDKKRLLAEEIKLLQSLKDSPPQAEDCPCEK